MGLCLLVKIFAIRIKNAIINYMSVFYSKKEVIFKYLDVSLY